MTIYNGGGRTAVPLTRQRLTVGALRQGWTLSELPRRLCNVLEVQKDGRCIRMSFTVKETLEAVSVDGTKVRGPSKQRQAVSELLAP